MNNIQRILVAIDNEPESKMVAEAALKLVEQFHSGVALVSVVDRPIIMMNNDIMGMGMGMNEDVITESEIEAGQKKNFERIHQQFMDTIFSEHQVKSYIVQGIPEDEIKEVAKLFKADLIVLGTHGRTGVEHFLIGSVSEKVIRHSEIPIFIVPTK